MKLINGDCLEAMDKIIEGGGVVDMVLVDPPYGTTACKWDSIIAFPDMWDRINKLVKDNGAVCIFGSEPFSSYLRMSNIKNYKYDWIWRKAKGSGFLNARKRPLKNHEVISVFYKKQPTYNPQCTKGAPYECKQGYIGEYLNGDKNSKEIKTVNTGFRYPLSVQDFKIATGYHPTQKPVALLEYLIKTYTNEGDTVLDFCMGSGSTGVACKNTGRDFIGIELDEGYFNIAKERIGEWNT